MLSPVQHESQQIPQEENAQSNGALSSSPLLLCILTLQALVALAGLKAGAPRPPPPSASFVSLPRPSLSTLNLCSHPCPTALPLPHSFISTNGEAQKCC